jgi:hypothetical protein
MYKQICKQPSTACAMSHATQPNTAARALQTCAPLHASTRADPYHLPLLRQVAVQSTPLIRLSCGVFATSSSCRRYNEVATHRTAHSPCCHKQTGCASPMQHRRLGFRVVHKQRNGLLATPRQQQARPDTSSLPGSAILLGFIARGAPLDARQQLRMTRCMQAGAQHATSCHASRRRQQTRTICCAAVMQKNCTKLAEQTRATTQNGCVDTPSQPCTHRVMLTKHHQMPDLHALAVHAQAIMLVAVHSDATAPCSRLVVQVSVSPNPASSIRQNNPSSSCN